MTFRQAFSDYSDRGEPRGSERIFADAAAEASPYASGPSDFERRHRGGLVLAGLSAACLLGVGVWLVSSGDDSVQTDAATEQGVNDPTGPSVPTDALPPFSEVEPGWIAYIIDATANEVGYVRTDEFNSPAAALKVHAKPDGELVGYGVPILGFVDRETFEEPGFDLEAYGRELLGDEEYDRRVARNESAPANPTE